MHAGISRVSFIMVSLSVKRSIKPTSYPGKYFEKYSIQANFCTRIHLWQSILSILNISTHAVDVMGTLIFSVIGTFLTTRVPSCDITAGVKILTMLKIHCHKLISRAEISLSAIFQLRTSIYYPVSVCGPLLTSGDRQVGSDVDHILLILKFRQLELIFDEEMTLCSDFHKQRPV